MWAVTRATQMADIFFPVTEILLIVYVFNWTIGKWLK